MNRHKQLFTRFLMTLVVAALLLAPALAAAAPARQDGRDGRSGFPTAVMDKAYFLNVRSGPGIEYPVQTAIARGTAVSLTGYHAANWVSVRLEGGTEGWVNFTYMSSTFPLSSLALWEGQEAPARDGRSSFPTAMMDQAYALNVRHGPGLAYEVVTAIPRGTLLELTGYRDEGSDWVSVRLPDGREGWVSAHYLSSDFPFANLVVAEAAQAPAEDGRSSLPAATVNAAYALNVRRGPGTGYAILTAIYRGAEVELTGYRNAAGNWVSVRLPDGTEGWAHAGYLSTDFPLSNLVTAG